MDFRRRLSAVFFVRNAVEKKSCNFHLTRGKRARWTKNERDSGDIRQLRLYVSERHFFMLKLSGVPYNRVGRRVNFVIECSILTQACSH